MIPSLISNPAGSVQCDACGGATHPTVTVDEKDDLPFTACEACCEELTPFAIQQAIQAAKSTRKVLNRDQMISAKRDEYGPPKLFDTRPVTEADRQRARRRKDARDAQCQDRPTRRRQAA